MRMNAAAVSNGSKNDNLARVNTPFEGWPVSPHQTAGIVFESVLAKAGATLPKRDAVDYVLLKWCARENR